MEGFRAGARTGGMRLEASNPEGGLGRNPGRRQWSLDWARGEGKQNKQNIGLDQQWGGGVSRTGPSALAWEMMKPYFRWGQERGAGFGDDWAEMNKGSYELDKRNCDSGHWGLNLLGEFWPIVPSPITGPDSEVTCWVNEDP